ncbi:MAG: HD domain-containing protein [Lachnospiraceae bacterium]|nr:HD domain-containing protein [Lachnospiraceae bacterium]
MKIVSIETFTGFIDAKDPYTNGHSKRVAQYTKMIAEEIGYGGEELDRIYYIALLHDYGKIGVPDSILGKPARLTDEEFEIIK